MARLSRATESSQRDRLPVFQKGGPSRPLRTGFLSLSTCRCCHPGPQAYRKGPQDGLAFRTQGGPSRARDPQGPPEACPAGRFTGTAGATRVGRPSLYCVPVAPIRVAFRRGRDAAADGTGPAWCAGGPPVVRIQPERRSREVPRGRLSVPPGEGVQLGLSQQSLADVRPDSRSRGPRPS